MKRCILLFLFIIFSTTAFNQIIKGKVLDKTNKSAIEFASIYFSGTFVGTHPDQNGYFELDVSKNSSMPLTISALGYYSFTLTDFKTDKPYVIYLEPKVFEIGEVVVTAKNKSNTRERYLRLFKQEFLGETPNARKCEITNENSIKFEYDHDGETLKAYCSDPILVNNKALGYKVTYYLDKFEYSKKDHKMDLKGNLFFEEDLKTSKTETERFERVRESVYLRSRMHFFRAIWDNQLKSSGFIVTNSKREILSVRDFVIPADSIANDSHLKCLKYEGNLYIGYLTEVSDSHIVFLNDYALFDRNGRLVEGIGWSGEMAKERVGDWLPFEYRAE
jgi:hypothetical protein